MWKKAVVACSKLLYQHLSGEVNARREELERSSYGWNLNPGLLEWEIRVLQTQPDVNVDDVKVGTIYYV
jgi:hypothetical protein